MISPAKYGRLGVFHFREVAIRRMEVHFWALSSLIRTFCTLEVIEEPADAERKSETAKVRVLHQRDRTLVRGGTRRCTVVRGGTRRYSVTALRFCRCSEDNSEPDVNALRQDGALEGARSQNFGVSDYEWADQICLRQSKP